VPAIGRPTDYTEELGDTICAGIAEGRSLVKICKDEGMPHTASVYRWRRLFKEFSDNYAHAREDAADVFAEQIITIPDEDVGNPVIVEGEPLMVNGKVVMAVDSASVAHAKLKVDSRKWIASRFNRAYIEKSSTETILKGSLTDMTEDALNRKLEQLRNEQAAEDSRD